MANSSLPFGCNHSEFWLYWAYRRYLICYGKRWNILALKIDAHNHWSDKELLNIAHANWPELTSDWDVSGRPEVDFSSPEIGKLRKAGINVIVKRSDGTSIIGEYGITAAGTSAGSTLALVNIYNMLVKSYYAIKAEMGDAELKLGIDKYNNICIGEPISNLYIPVCNIPDISNYSYLFKGIGE